MGRWYPSRSGKRPGRVVPLTLLGVRRRCWLIAVGALALAGVPFLPLWRWFYSIDNIPLILIGA